MNKLGILQWIKSDSLSIRVTKDAAGNFAIQVGFAGISLALAVILARLLGANGYGSYSNAIAWANIFTVFAPFGFGALLVRNVAVLNAQSKWPALKGLIQFSDGFVVVLSILLMAALGGIAAAAFSGANKETMFLSLIFAAPLIPLWAFAILRQSMMRGLEKTLHAMLPDTIIRPGVTVIGIILFYFLWPSKFSSLTAIWINVGASAIALGVAVVWMKKLLPKEVSSSKPEYEIKNWINSAIPLFFYSGAQIIIVQSPIVLLGMFSSVVDVGMFSVAARLANTMVYLPMAVGLVISPLMARFNARGEKKRLQNMLTKTSWTVFIISLFLGLMFWLFGKYLLAIFGQEFILAYPALIVLVLGYLVDVSMGSSINLLIMCGYEGIIATISGINALMNVVLCVVIIPRFGFEGAACVSFFTIIVSRCVFAFYAQKKLDLNTTVLSRIW